jgi:uncharacterized protein
VSQSEHPERRLSCAICRRPVPPRAANPAFPFCTERCRLIDLGNWLGEAYRVPEPPDESDKNPSPETDE